jgi:hypothetical protein
MAKGSNPDQRVLGNCLMTFACLIPAWMVAHEAQQNYQDPTGPFIMTLLMLVGLNPLCWGIANRLGRALLNFSGQVMMPPKATVQAVPQPVSVAVSGMAVQTCAKWCAPHRPRCRRC